MSDRDLLDGLIDAERRGAAAPSEAQARAGWSRLQRALPGAVIAPQIDVPPASVEAATAGKLFLLGHASGWVGKTVIGAVVAATIGTVGVVATREDARRDPPTAVATVAPAPAPREEPPPPAIPPAPLPAAPPTVITPQAIAPIDVPAVPPIDPPGKPRTRGAAKPSGPRAAASTPTLLRPSALDSEQAIIDAAFAAVGRGDAREALTLIGEHAARWPKGNMAEDREALRVVALCRLGRTADAARARGKFLARWPSSMHDARVRAACPEPTSAK